MRTEVKIYTYFNERDLENKIKSLYEHFDIIDIKYSIESNGGSMTKYSALVIFRKVIG